MGDRESDLSVEGAQEDAGQGHSQIMGTGDDEEEEEQFVQEEAASLGASPAPL
jgi:hypothetical protein